MERCEKKAAAHGMVHSQRRRANKQLVSAVVEQLVHKLFKSLRRKKPSTVAFISASISFGSSFVAATSCDISTSSSGAVWRIRSILNWLAFFHLSICPLTFYDFSGVIFVVAALIIPHFCRDFAALCRTAPCQGRANL